MYITHFFIACDDIVFTGKALPVLGCLKTLVLKVLLHWEPGESVFSYHLM